MDKQTLGIFILIAGLAASFLFWLADVLSSKRNRERDKAAYQPEDTSTFVIRTGGFMLLSCLMAVASIFAALALGSITSVVLAVFFGVYGIVMLWMLVSGSLWRVVVYDDHLVWRDGNGRTRTYRFEDVVESMPTRRRQGYYLFRFADGRQLTIELRSKGLTTLIRRCADRTGRGRMQHWD